MVDSDQSNPKVKLHYRHGKNSWKIQDRFAIMMLEKI